MASKTKYYITGPAETLRARFPKAEPRLSNDESKVIIEANLTDAERSALASVADVTVCTLDEIHSFMQNNPEEWLPEVEE